MTNTTNITRRDLQDASPKQINYVKLLLREREVTPPEGQTVEDLIAQADNLGFAEAKAWIDVLKDKPKKPREPREASVPVVVPFT